MKVFVLLALCFMVAACNDGGAPSGGSRSKIANKKDSLSYFFGTTIGNSMRRDSLEMNAEMIYAGVRDALGGDTTILADSGYKRLVETFSSEMQAKAMARQQREMMEQQMKDSIAGLKNKSEGEAYLAANKAKPDVVTLPSGLQYKVIKEGTGATPKATDQVLVLYRGTTLNGHVFDSSGVQPATFNVSQVVPGWTEALTKMKAGSKWQLVIPSDLAYGPQSPGRDIGPNAVLLFDIELVSILPPQAEGQQGMPPGMQSMPGGPGTPGHP